MIDAFETCFAFTLRAEGGYVDDPADPGGPSNMGITLATLRQWSDDPDLGAAQVEDMRLRAAIYRSLYWNPLRADALPCGVDLMVFDMGVNAGTGGRPGCCSGRSASPVRRSMAASARKLWKRRPNAMPAPSLMIWPNGKRPIIAGYPSSRSSAPVGSTAPKRGGALRLGWSRIATNGWSEVRADCFSLAGNQAIGLLSLRDSDADGRASGKVGDPRKSAPCAILELLELTSSRQSKLQRGLAPPVMPPSITSSAPVM
jgi:Glycosyl hydrolase 108